MLVPPVGYHLVNLIIHICTSLFVWRLVTLILSTPAAKGNGIAEHKELVASGCSLLFLTHPVQTQAVTYIVQRYASLAALFYLSSVSLYVKARLVQSKTRFLFFAISGCTAILGFFTKEIVFTLPFSLLLVEVYFFSGGIKNLTILRSRWFWLAVVIFVVFFSLFLWFPRFIYQRYSMRKHLPVLLSFYTTPTVLSFLFILFLIGTAVMLFSRHLLVSFGIMRRVIQRKLFGFIPRLST